ncbi:translation initiation factor IF-2 subunit beta [Candidatus Woesearchaeota archaeon]|nr:translation initiation factor IF-2 subunit beta [Candidatus Woesearchaeota archaeon]
MEYPELLKRARANLPESVLKHERFDIPKSVGHIEGNKTIISNFSQICDTFRREPSQLLKYLQRELATPAHIDGSRLILGRKMSSSLINAKIEEYANTFVLCYECKKPDTQLIKQDKVTIIKCQACGARHPLKSKI